MRLYVRLTRNTGISLGPAALALLSPFLIAWWAWYGAWLAARFVVLAARAIAQRA